jgi:hypothetical protein
MLGGGPIPYANLVRDVRSMPASGGSYEDYSPPSYDTSVAASSTASQEINDTDALTASMAAAEEENDEANAATLQTEINAGM